MGWFNSNPLHTCNECGITYRVIEASHYPFAHLCPEHRRGPMETARRKHQVIEWVLQNFDLVSRFMDEQQTEAHRRAIEQNQAYYSQMAQAMNNAPPPNPYGGTKR